MTGVESNISPAMGVLMFNLLTAWPLWRIYRRAGLPGWWSLVAFAPLIGLVAAVALLGHVRWPRLPQATPAPRKRRRAVDAAGKSSK